MQKTHTWMFFAALLFTLLLAGCSQTIAPTEALPEATAGMPTRPPDPTPEPDLPAPTQPPPAPTAFAPAPVLDVAVQDPRPVYRIDAALDFATGKAAVRQTIVFTNPASPDDGSIVLIVDANGFPEMFMLEALRWGDGSAVEDWRLDGGALSISTTREAEPAAPLTLEIEYTLRLPAAQGKTGYFAGQLNLGDWYPMLAVYDSQRGWLAHPPGPAGETTVYGLADYEIRLRINNAPQGLVVAGSGPCVDEAGVRVCRGTAMRNFAFSMSPLYRVLETVTAGEPAVTIRSYFFEEEAAAGQTAMLAAKQSIEWFSELFGPYPHPTYSVLPANFPDGLEFDGLTYVGREYYDWFNGTAQDYLYLLVVHEAAHQWWYALVGNDQAYEPWLDEALATYSELIFLEQFHPELLDWWWALRINTYRPLGGHVNDPVYAHDGFRPYVNAVYLRGAVMMQEIRDEMGDEPFLAALRAYADAYAGRLATGSDLLAVFNGYSGADLSLIYERYFSMP